MVGVEVLANVIAISGRWNRHWVNFYFNLSSGVLHGTSSHIRGRWYLPMFLFRDGWLTLMCKASFMVLMRFWSSLPTMLKLSKGDIMTWDVKMVIWGRRLLMVFEPHSKCSCRFTNILLITLHPVIFISVYDSTFLQDVVFILLEP